MRMNFRKDNKGLILVTILAMMVILASLIGSLFLTLYYNNQLAKKQINSTKAYYLAVTGMQYIRLHYFDTYAGGGINPSTTVNSATFSITPDGDLISVTRVPTTHYLNSEITSTGTINGVTRTITCQSGDSRFSLTNYVGLEGVCSDGADSQSVFNSQISECQLPVLKWEIEKE